MKFILGLLVALGVPYAFENMALAGDLKEPVMIIADGDLDTCGVGKVTGLNPKGDNFLAVRAGPGAKFKLLDKIHTDDLVWMFQDKGDWIGIVYGSDDISCSPVKADKPYDGPGKQGWVFKKYITLIAG